MPNDNQTEQQNEYPYTQLDPEGQFLARCVGAIIFGMFVLWQLSANLRETKDFWTVFIGGCISWLILIAMMYQARISHRQWQVMQTQVRAAKDAAASADYAHRVENRPYLGITRIDFVNTVTSGEWVSVIAHNMNCGRTPALNCRSRIDTGASTLDVVPEGVRPTPNVGLKDKGIHLPGVPTTLVAELPPNCDTRVELRSDPNLRLYTWGTIDYDDIWGYHHQTRFAFLNPDPNKALWWACETGNTMTTNDAAPEAQKTTSEENPN